MSLLPQNPHTQIMATVSLLVFGCGSSPLPLFLFALKIWATHYTKERSPPGIQRTWQGDNLFQREPTVPVDLRAINPKGQIPLQQMQRNVYISGFHEIVKCPSPNGTSQENWQIWILPSTIFLKRNIQISPGPQERKARAARAKKAVLAQRAPLTETAQPRGTASPHKSSRFMQKKLHRVSTSGTTN